MPFWDKRGSFHKDLPEVGDLEMGVVGERGVWKTKSDHGFKAKESLN